MLKKRKGKDDGFTLIELMIVIAVIGILAIVLIPKVGTIKTQAKSAGLETNMRMVQGYVESRITYWNDKQGITAAGIADDIEAAFQTAASGQEMKNPFSGATAVENKFTTGVTLSPNDSVALQITDTASTATGEGVIEVVVPDDADLSSGIEINAKNNNGTVYSSITVNP